MHWERGSTGLSRKGIGRVEDSYPVQEWGEERSQV